MQEYKIPKRWKFFLYTTLLIFAILLIWGATFLIDNGTNTFFEKLFFVGLISIFLILIVVAAIDTHKRKVIFFKDRVISFSIFGKTELLFNEIKGYRQAEKEIALESVTDTIKISTYFENYDEIVTDIVHTFPDLDVLSAFTEKYEVLNDNSLGITEADREAKLKQAKLVAKILNTLAWISFAWIFFYPEPYQYPFILCIILPPAAILAVKYFKGIIRIDEKKVSHLPNIIIVLLFPSLGMALRILVDYNIVSYQNVWAPIVLLTGTLVFLLYFRQKEFSFKKRNDYIIAVLISVMLLGYSYGLVGHVNCYYDQTAPEFYTAKIMNKRISSGNVETHYLKLSKWGHQTEEGEASVNENFYLNVEIGQELIVVYRKGNLDIPWYYVEQKW